MELDEQTFKKLLETFKQELEERLQEITDGILQLEKKDLSSDDKNVIIEKIFRSAHNIKGAARTLGIKDIGEISHQIETLFSNIQKNPKELQSVTIDLCLEGVDCMRSAMQSFVENKPLLFDLANLLESLGKNEVTATGGKTETTFVPKNTSPTQPGYETIRVSIENLDRISAILEEVQVAKIVLDDHYSELTKLTAVSKHLSVSWRQFGFAVQAKSLESSVGKMYGASYDEFTELHYMIEQLHRNMRSSINDLDMLSNTMQDEVRTLRLMPASILLQSLPRVVRDIASDLKKSVVFDCTGESVKIDKMVLEGLQDPIIHLLRNAIDHGIESPEIRRSKGKPEAGHIQLDILEDGDHILITITDDGAGIDQNKIAAQLLNKKMLTSSELDHLKSEDIIEYIFHPGFSTKEIITDVSGRGVGLDVVKSNLMNLKGQVSVKTTVDKGTVFTLRVPLTLSSERGLLVSASGQLFVLPTNLIERVLTIPVNEIKEVEASQAVILNNQAIPLKMLTDILGIKQAALVRQDKLPIIIIRKNQQAIAFVVDDIIGEREIVIKPLQPPLVDIPCVVGGTLAGNGQVIIVLNTSDLIARAQQIGKMIGISFEDGVEKLQTRPHILIVDDSITTRTLEKNILESQNYQVTTAVNGKEAWDMLQNKKFSLLITDVMMPIMDGFALTERVKQSKEFADLPVIIVTSLGSEAEKARGVQVGANAYIVKNEFESEKLLEIVEQLV